MRQETQGALTPLPPAVEGAGVWIVAHALRDAEVERGGGALPLCTPLRVPVVLHSQERVARLLTRASEGAPVGVNLSKMESTGYQSQEHRHQLSSGRVLLHRAGWDNNVDKEASRTRRHKLQGR